MSRFISIIIIVALGTGFFVGVKSAAPSMEETAEQYFSDNNLMDLRVQSSIGLTGDDLTAIKNIEGVSGAMGAKFVDALVLVNGQPEIDLDGTQISTRAYGIDLNMLQAYYYGANDKNFINRPTLLEGTYPTKSNQCLVDESSLSTPDSYQIGSKIKLEADANTDLSSLAVTEFEIVGVIRSPYYISFERGNSLVGSGKIGTFIYIPESAFTSDYYSEIYVTVDGSDAYDPFSDAYIQYLKPVADRIREVGATNIATRTNELKESLPGEIASAKQAYQTSYATLQTRLQEAEEQIALYQKYVDDPEGSYNEAVKQAAEALGLAAEEFNGNSSAYYDAIETYNQNLEAYKAAKAAQSEKYKQLTEAQRQYAAAESALTAAENAFNSATQFVSSTQNIIDTTSTVLSSLEAYQNGQMDNSQIAQVLATLESINPDLYHSIASLSAVSMATEAIALVTPYLDQQKTQLAAYQEQLEASKQELTETKEKFSAAATVLSAAKTAYEAADVQLNAYLETLRGYYDELEGSKTDLSMAQFELMLNESSVSNDLNLLKATIANAQTYLDKAKKEYTETKESAEAALADAQKKIDAAENLLAKLDTAKWNLYDRTDTPGYTSYDGAVHNIKVLSNIFPVIFFLVAALVCLTTMSRMVEEERTQMGTMKAIGYSSIAIATKYILYALFASVVGSALGIVIGVYALPYAVFKAYSIMFTMPSLSLSFPVVYILLGMAISLLTTLLAAGIACARELRVHPASLMRPKAPKPGKRVLLEKIPFIWKHISFTGKVTVRNLFRRKVRFLMTVIGIGGCTALVLASIGLYSSVHDIMPKQYGDDGIAAYDVQIVFADNQTDDSAMMELLHDDSRITDLMLSSVQSVTGGSDRIDKTQDVYLFVPKDCAKLSSLIHLQNRSTGETLTLDDSGAIITESFAKDTDTQIGDSVWIINGDGEQFSIPVAGITENYAFNYIYLSENLYQYIFQEPVTYNYAIGTVDPSILTDEQTKNVTATKKSQFTTDLMAYDSINAVAFTSDTVDTLNEVINVLSMIIAIFIVAAGLLAFIVLYNLSNINISERQRELATIKVLGFHDKEVSAYIYRENVVLTIIGILLGLLLGVFVHKLLIIYCAVDTVMYVQTLRWYSFVIAAAMTTVFAVIVNFLMHKKMQKIDMVESLKAIE